MQLFERYWSGLSKDLADLGLHETLTDARARDAAGLAACQALPERTRSCLLDAPVAAASWSTCQAEPPFRLFDGTKAHEALLGPPVAPADSVTRVAALAETWHQPATELNDAVTWNIDKAGTLKIRRTPAVRPKVKGQPAPKPTKPADEPSRQLGFARERLLEIKLGTSTQFAPFYRDRDGNTLYVSWTSGAIAVPVTDDTKFALDLADDGRWLVWRAPTCTVVDPRRGATPATCGWEEPKDPTGPRVFTVGNSVAQRWTLREGALVHPAMERFTKQR